MTSPGGGPHRQAWQPPRPRNYPPRPSGRPDTRRRWPVIFSERNNEEGDE